MIIQMSDGIANGGGLDVGELPVKVGDGLRLSFPGQPIQHYKVYPNGVARLVDHKYVTLSSGRTWRFRDASKVVNL